LLGVGDVLNHTLARARLSDHFGLSAEQAVVV